MSIRQIYGFCIFSAILLILSLILLVMLQFPDIWERVPMQWWIHLAIIVIIAIVFWQFRKLLDIAPYRRLGFFNGLPVWLLGLVVIIVLIVIPIWLPYVFYMKETPTGESIYRKHIFEYEGKYYIRLNKEPSIEISRSEYFTEEREIHKFFVSMWLFVSCIALILWQYLWRWKMFIEENNQLTKDI